MLSKSQIKYIRSLSQQKYRKENKAFVAEGDKIVKEWLQSDAEILMTVATQKWFDENVALIRANEYSDPIIVDEHVLEQISGLKTSNQVLLVLPLTTSMKDIPNDEWVIALEKIQDPGNMGTIIRIADWFGIEHIVCSEDCVDVYNPKVVQAAMGGHIRVNTHIVDLEKYVSETSLTVYAATLEGQSIHEVEKANKGVILIGNESKGLSHKLVALSDKKITIPRKGRAESLNAGVSTGIITALLIHS